MFFASNTCYIIYYFDLLQWNYLLYYVLFRSTKDRKPKYLRRVRGSNAFKITDGKPEADTYMGSSVSARMFNINIHTTTNNNRFWCIIIIYLYTYCNNNNNNLLNMRFRRYTHCFPPRHVYCCSIKKRHSKQLTDLRTVIIHYNHNRFLFRIRTYRHYSITQCVLRRYSLVLDVFIMSTGNRRIF